MYPRQQQHCFSHHIPETVITLKDEPISTDTERATALKYLLDKHADLVKGDLVLFDSSTGYRNSGVTIFNGTEIIQLYSEVDDYGSVPPEFHVIENGVSIDYWGDIDETDTGRGITHNNIVWFNHLLVQDQCLKNLIYEYFEYDKYGIFTSFTYNDKIYRIVFDYADSLYEVCDKDTYQLTSDAQRDLTLDACRQALQSKTMIVFESESEFYPDIFDRCTLFVRMS